MIGEKPKFSPWVAKPTLRAREEQVYNSEVRTQAIGRASPKEWT